MKAQDERNRIGRVRCPYLGLEDDPQTAWAFPNDTNCCHRPPSPEPIKPAYQSSHCLTRSYADCAVFCAEREWSGRLPPNVRTRTLRRVGHGLKLLLVFAAIVLIGVVATLLLLAAPRAALVPVPPPTATQTPTPIPTSSPIQTATATLMATPSPSPSATLAANATATPAPAGLLEVVLAFDSNLREGPGIEYPVAAYRLAGQKLNVLGRNSFGNWLYVETQDGLQAWLYFTQIDHEQINIVALPTMPGLPTVQPSVTETAES